MKKTETNFMILTTLFVISIVIANVVGARVITTGISIGSITLSMSGGAITYAVTFLCTDIISELWGKEKAKSVIKYGFIGQVFALICIVITGLCPAVDPTMNGAYMTLLGQNWVFVTGSLCAYYCSQTWDVYIFHKLRQKFKWKWLRNNGSTMTSQIIDTVVYATICFGLGMGWFFTEGMMGAFIGLVVGQYLLKAFIALCDTPVFYLLTRNSNRVAEVVA